MVVVFSKQVQDKIDEYALALTSYPITHDRCEEKVQMLKEALTNLGGSVVTPQLCTYKDLGQVFDINGKPQNKNLRRFNYQDKSGFQWAFGCIFNQDADRITIVKMMAANQVKEELFREILPILEFMKRLDAVR